MDLYLNIKKALNMYIYLFFTPLNKMLLRLNKVTYGKGLKVRGVIHIFRHSTNSTVQIGRQASINSARWATRIGCGDRTNIQMMGSGALIIGDNCGFSKRRHHLCAIGHDRQQRADRLGQQDIRYRLPFCCFQQDQRQGHTG